DETKLPWLETITSNSANRDIPSAIGLSIDLATVALRRQSRTLMRTAGSLTWPDTISAVASNSRKANANPTGELKHQWCVSSCVNWGKTPGGYFPKAIMAMSNGSVKSRRIV